MSKIKLPKNRRNIALLIILAFITSLGFKYLSVSKQKTPVEVFSISEASLDYGYSTLTGKLQKDTPVGVDGDYFISSPDGTVIFLDSQGLDSLVGLSLTISGILLPPELSSPGYIKVSEISIATNQ